MKMGLYADRSSFAGLTRDQLIASANGAANRVAGTYPQNLAVRAAAQSANAKLGMLEAIEQRNRAARAAASSRPNMVQWSGRVYDELDRNPDLNQAQLMSRTGATQPELQRALLYLQGQQRVTLDGKRGRYSIAPPPTNCDASGW